MGSGGGSDRIRANRRDGWGLVGTVAGRWIRREQVGAACGAVLAVHLVLLAVMFATARGGRTALGAALGADYAGFYVAATILDEHPPERLYDLAVQDRLYHRLLPERPAGESLPYAHAPLLAVVLRPLARLPYAWSYAAWLALAAGLVLAGLGLARRAAGAIGGDDWRLARLLVLTFQPLLMEGWLGGQMAVVGFFAVAAALGYAGRAQPFAAGAALALLSYKPTLLVLVPPMLLAAGPLRAAAGFAAAGLVLAACSLLAVGRSGCLAYADLLWSYAERTSGGSTGFKTFKHVDLNTFFTLLAGGPGPPARLALLAAALPLLALAWRAGGRRGGGGDCRLLAWCATFSWAPVFNLYAPVYDTTLVLPGVLMTADVLARRSGGTLPPGFRVLVALLVLTPWITQALARSAGFQPLTLVLLALGAYQIALVRALDVSRRGGRRMPSWVSVQ
jgi:hypothetical protein